MTAPTLTPIPSSAPRSHPVDSRAGVTGNGSPPADTSAAPAAGNSMRSIRWDQVDWRQVARRGLLVIALTVVAFVVWLIVISGLVFDSSQDTLRRSFDDQLRDGLAPVNQPIEPGAPVAFLEIPALGMEQVVVEGTTADVTATGPGHLRTSALPGQPGVSVVLGRRATFGGVFGALPQLRNGDAIEVTTGQGTLTYTVSSTTTYPADDAAAFVADGDALLLVTSDPGLVASGRLVVTAEPDGELFERGARVPQSPPTPAELGLGGDWSAAVGLLIWLEIAAVAIVVALLLLRRWYRWPTWVLVVPLLAAVTWLVFQQFALLLPATL